MRCPIDKLQNVPEQSWLLDQNRIGGDVAVTGNMLCCRSLLVVGDTFYNFNSSVYISNSSELYQTGVEMQYQTA